MASKTSSLKSQVLSGVRWMAVERVGTQIPQFIITVILARILSPDDYGLIGMIAVFVGFVSIFTELGFASALIQRAEISENHRSSVFWLNLAAGVLITIGFAAMGPLFAAFYGEPVLAPLTAVIALNFFISAFNDVQTALLRRDMAFRRLVIINMITVIASGGVAIAFALSGLGVWSLVAQLVTANLVEVAIMWWTTPWKPQFIFDRSALKDLMGFSLPYLGANIFNYLIRNTDNLLIGKYVNTSSLGLYRQAYSLMMLPVNQVTKTMATVMFPALSRIQDDTAQVKAVFLRLQGAIAIITVPMMVGLLMVAEPFVLTVFGEKWVGMIPFLQVLCLVGIKQPFGATTGLIFTSQGKTGLQLRWVAFSAIVTLISFFIGIRWGAMGIAVAYAIRTYVLWYPGTVIPGRLIGLGFGEHLQNVAGILGIAFVMALVVWIIGYLLPADLPVSFKLLIQVIAGGVIYMTLVHLFQLSAYKDLISVLQTKGFRSKTASKI